jgi:hypothetical protein
MAFVVVRRLPRAARRATMARSSRTHGPRPMNLSPGTQREMLSIRRFEDSGGV